MDSSSSETLHSEQSSSTPEIGDKANLSSALRWPEPSISQAKLVELLKEVIPTEQLVLDEESQRPFECDGLAVYTELPLLVVLASSLEQVQHTLRVCHEYDIPVVPRGAGTGLSAGALPHRHGVLLSVSKMNQILSIDADARTASVQPGVRNQAISEAAKSEGLYYAPDPSSQIACSIGGNIAENSGGVHCLKYGLTVHNVLQVEMVSMAGERLVFGSAGLDSPGPDLLALINGSEGLLGVVTEILVKLLPIPAVTRVVLAGFPSVKSAADAVGAVIAAGIIPGGLEMMDKMALQAAEDFAQAGYPTDAEALLICELDGSAAQVEAHIAAVSEVFEAHDASTIRVSQSDAEREKMWVGRKSAFPAIGRISPDYYCMDGTIPRGKIASVLAEIQALSEQHGLRVANVFHAGDGNLHPLILFDASVDGELETAEALGADILRACVSAGGNITGEHGVGVEKIGQMHDQFTDAELRQFHALKAAFDPHNQLNPGKGIPMLKHCQEYRSLADFSELNAVSHSTHHH